MLTMVTAQNPQSGTLLLPLMDASGGYVVKEIQGLDPVKATLVSSGLAQMDGAQLHNARREARNITIKLGLEPDFVTSTVASLRANLYRYFMPKTTIIFSLYSDDVLFGVTEAVVESMDNNMFTADPEINISLICYDPDFYAPAPTVIDGSTVDNVTNQLIPYEGTTETGIIFTLIFPDVANELRLYNTRPDHLLTMLDIQGSFLANDKLVINTNPGSKSVDITRGGMVKPSLYCLDRNSSWISLIPGDNLFRAYFAGSPVPFTLEYTARYGGF